MRTVCIIDTETGGLDPSQHPCIEVAVILYSVTHATPLRAFSSLIRSASNDARAINGIPQEALVDAPEPVRVWEHVARLADEADAIVAHNAEFDRGFVPSWLAQARPWICSKNDIAWPKATRPGEHLVSLALAHGCGVASAHRAMADCDMLSRLFTRCAESGTDIAAMLTHAMRPKATYRADVSFAEKDLAKNAGFKWDGDTKLWTRTMFCDDAAALGFRVVRMGA